MKVAGIDGYKKRWVADSGVLEVRREFRPEIRSSRGVQEG